MLIRLLFFKKFCDMKKNAEPSSFSKKFEKISGKITHVSGSPAAVLVAAGVVVVWALLGPVFNYSDTWQLVINTSTTIITFIMVFVIQHSQNKDTTAMQLKLNELIAANEKASNRLINIEDLTDEELQLIKSFYKKLAELSQKEKAVFTTHSLDEATQVHQNKIKSVKN